MHGITGCNRQLDREVRMDFECGPDLGLGGAIRLVSGTRPSGKAKGGSGK